MRVESVDETRSPAVDELLDALASRVGEEIWDADRFGVELTLTGGWGAGRGDVGERGRTLAIVHRPDDLDPDSLDTLTELAGRRDAAMLVVSRGPTRLPPALVGLGHDALLVRLRVPSLDWDAVHALAAGMLGGIVPWPTVAQLVARTGGNPFLVESLLVGALRSGGLHERAGVWMLDSRAGVVAGESLCAPFTTPELDALALIADAGTMNAGQLAEFADVDVVRSLHREGILEPITPGGELRVVPEVLAEALCVRRGDRSRSLDRWGRVGRHLGPGEDFRTMARRVQWRFEYRISTGVQELIDLAVNANEVDESSLAAECARRALDIAAPGSREWHFANLELARAVMNAGRAVEAVEIAARSEPSDDPLVIDYLFRLVALLRYFSNVGLDLYERARARWMDGYSTFDDMRGSVFEGAELVDLLEKLHVEERFGDAIEALDRRHPYDATQIDECGLADRMFLLLIRGQALARLGRVAEGCGLLLRILDELDEHPNYANYTEHAFLRLCLYSAASGYWEMLDHCVERYGRDRGSWLRRIGPTVELSLAIRSVMRARPSEALLHARAAQELFAARDAAGLAQMARAVAEATAENGDITALLPLAAVRGAAASDRSPSSRRLAEAFADIVDDQEGPGEDPHAPSRGVTTESAASAAIDDLLGRGDLLLGLHIAYAATVSGDDAACGRLVELTRSIDAPTGIATHEAAEARIAGSASALLDAAEGALRVGIERVALDCLVAALESEQEVDQDRASRLYYRLGPDARAHAASLRPYRTRFELTGREREVAELLTRGHAIRDAAKTLHLSVRTVEGHSARAMQKLGAHRREEFLARFRQVRAA